MRAPVRLAVSAIFSADWSSTRWSYPRSRIRTRGAFIFASDIYRFALKTGTWQGASTLGRARLYHLFGVVRIVWAFGIHRFTDLPNPREKNERI